MFAFRGKIQLCPIPDSPRGREIRIHESITAFVKFLGRIHEWLLVSFDPLPPPFTRLPSSRERLPRIIHIYDQTLYQPHLPRIHLIETSVSEAIGCEPCVVSGGVTGNTMAQPLDGRSLRFSWPSLTAVNDPDGTPGYFNSNAPTRSFLLLARFTIRREWLVAKFATETHPHSDSPVRKVSIYSISIKRWTPGWLSCIDYRHISSHFLVQRHSRLKEARRVDRASIAKKSVRLERRSIYELHQEHDYAVVKKLATLLAKLRSI